VTAIAEISALAGGIVLKAPLVVTAAKWRFPQPRRALARADEMGYQQARWGDYRKWDLPRQLAFE
jgi:hypothetical protein